MPRVEPYTTDWSSWVWSLLTRELGFRQQGADTALVFRAVSPSLLKPGMPGAFAWAWPAPLWNVNLGWSLCVCWLRCPGCVLLGCNGFARVSLSWKVRERGSCLSADESKIAPMASLPESNYFCTLFFCFLFCHSSSILEILTVHVSILDVIWTGPGTEARIRGFSSQCRDFLEHKMFDACTWELNNFPQDSLPCVGRTLFAICYRLSNSNGCCRAYMEGTVCLACAIKTGLYTHCFAELRVEFFSYDTVFDLDFSGTNF